MSRVDRQDNPELAAVKAIFEDIYANGSDKMSRFAERLLDQYETLFLFLRYEGL